MTKVDVFPSDGEVEIFVELQSKLPHEVVEPKTTEITIKWIYLENEADTEVSEGKIARKLTLTAEGH